MTSKSSKRAEDFATLWNPFAIDDKNPMAFAASVQARCIKAALASQMEVLDFLQGRLAKDMAIVDRLARTHEAPEMLTKISGFVQEAFDDYSQETVKIAGFGSRMAVDTAQEMQKHSEDFANGIKAVASAA